MKQLKPQLNCFRNPLDGAGFLFVQSEKSHRRDWLDARMLDRGEELQVSPDMVQGNPARGHVPVQMYQALLADKPDRTYLTLGKVCSLGILPTRISDYYISEKLFYRHRK